MGALRSLLPLVALLIVVGGAAFVGYQIYLWTNEMAERGKRKMEKKHVSFTKDGMKVGVRGINDEDYADKTQSYLVKAWNYSSFPAYKSRFWNTESVDHTPLVHPDAANKPKESEVYRDTVGFKLWEERLEGGQPMHFSIDKM